MDAMQLNLKKLRLQRSPLTQKRLAKLCDDLLEKNGAMITCNTRKIQRLEQDDFQYLERDLIDALCVALNCNIDDLIKIERA